MHLSNIATYLLIDNNVQNTVARNGMPVASCAVAAPSYPAGQI